MVSTLCAKMNTKNIKMSDYLKIKGVNSILLTGEKPLPGKEYLISIRAELYGITKDIKDPENPSYTYLLAYLATEGVQEIGTKKMLKVQNGKTPSQKLRFAIEAEAKQLGLDRDEYYEQEMNKLISQRMERIK